MNFGLELSLEAAPVLLGRGDAISSPADIAGLSFWWDPQDISTLWQDSAKTTPVASAGDPVGHMADKSGNGRNVEQGTAGARPVFAQNAGGFRSLTFFSPRCLQNAIINTPVSTVFAVAFTDTTSDSFASLLSNLTDQAAGVDFVWTRDTLTNAWFVSQGTGLGLADATHFWRNGSNTTNWDTATAAIYSADGTGHASPVLPTGVNIGLDRNVAGRYFLGSLYVLFGYNSILSAYDRARVHTYLSNRYGIALAA